MKILSMTATFGKLDHKTLTLEPGLNIIEAPNEWGKSTWCAFILAMLYGISTKEQSKTGFLADKEHYAPWSGAPMSGRMDILWNGRRITLERSTKTRPFGIFKAYETDTGLPVPELTADNCGQTLLGVERGVFQRSGFIKLTDLPITQDEALRRRLNALVTTGDESGTGDTLQKTLKELKNNCRHNKTGRLPAAENQQAVLQAAIRQIDELLTQKQQYLQQQAQVQAQLRDLENHRQALLYTQNLTYAQKLSAAQVAKENAQQAVLQAENAVRDLPPAADLQAAATRVQTLQTQKSDLHMQAQLIPLIPNVPEAADVFRGLDPEQAVQMAAQDAKTAEVLQAKTAKFPFIGLILAVVGAALAMMIQSLPVRIGGVVLAAAGIVLLVAQLSRKKEAEKALSALQAKYRGIPHTQWESDACRFRDLQKDYQAQLQQREKALTDINRQLAQADQALNEITGSRSPAEFLQYCSDAREAHRQAAEARQQLLRSEEFLQALSSNQKVVAPPKYEDHLTFTEDETAGLTASANAQLQQLQKLLGSCQGQMEALGDREQLEKELQQVAERIRKLEDTYAALELAMSALTTATQELQRRFAPRISQRAQELLSRLTDGRYERLILDSEFVVHTGAEAEDTLHTPLWRSDGTADQLYLALRLAVAEELTPDAPLILDDALVRFDDKRLAAALSVLKETAENKQVILFTCHNREKTLAQ